MSVCACTNGIQASQSLSLFSTTFISPGRITFFQSGHSFNSYPSNFLHAIYPTYPLQNRNLYINTMKSTIIIATLVAAVFGAPIAPPQSRQAGSNFQTFTAALGNIAATPVVDSGIANRKFQVKNDTFVNIGAALQRSCDQQFNACANAANGGGAAFKVADCSAQKGTSFELFVRAMAC
jgi:hypothetical protein